VEVVQKLRFPNNSNIKKEIIKQNGNEDRNKYVSIKEEEYKWFFEKVINLANLE
jgi:hypothetical protein